MKTLGRITLIVNLILTMILFEAEANIHNYSPTYEIKLILIYLTGHIIRRKVDIQENKSKDLVCYIENILTKSIILGRLFEYPIQHSWGMKLNVIVMKN